jgi:hypothetical protein
MTRTSVTSWCMIQPRNTRHLVYTVQQREAVVGEALLARDVRELVNRPGGLVVPHVRHLRLSARSHTRARTQNSTAYCWLVFVGGADDIAHVQAALRHLLPRHLCTQRSHHAQSWCTTRHVTHTMPSTRDTRPHHTHTIARTKSSQGLGRRSRHCDRRVRTSDIDCCRFGLRAHQDYAYTTSRTHTHAPRRVARDAHGVLHLDDRAEHSEQRHFGAQRHDGHGFPLRCARDVCTA